MEYLYDERIIMQVIKCECLGGIRQVENTVQFVREFLVY